MKELLPPVLLNAYRHMRRSGITFTGPYRSWQEAKEHSVGYDSELILEKVKNAMLKVKSGGAAYERDGVVFEEIAYSFPVLAGLLKAAVAREGRLHVLDFGGSLGSSFYQCRTFLCDLKVLRWSIVEQPRFVSCGKELFETEQLRFFGSIDECIEEERVDAVLLSSVLQYLESPYATLRDLVAREIEYIIIDRTPFTVRERDVLTVQHVPAAICKSSYPSWIFGWETFRRTFETGYSRIAQFNSQDGTVKSGGFNAHYKGMILKLRRAR